MINGKQKTSSRAISKLREKLGDEIRKSWHTTRLGFHEAKATKEHVKLQSKLSNT